MLDMFLITAQHSGAEQRAWLTAAPGHWMSVGSYILTIPHNECITGCYLSRISLYCFRNEVVKQHTVYETLWMTKAIWDSVRRATFQQAYCVWMPDSNLYVQLPLIVTLIQGDLHSSASYSFPVWVFESGEPFIWYQSKPVAPVWASHGLRGATCPTPKYQNPPSPSVFADRRALTWAVCHWQMRVRAGAIMSTLSKTACVITSGSRRSEVNMPSRCALWGN